MEWSQSNRPSSNTYTTYDAANIRIRLHIHVQGLVDRSIQGPGQSTQLNSTRHIGGDSTDLDSLNPTLNET